MTKIIDESINKFFGNDWTEQYLNATKQKRVPWFKAKTPEEVEEIKQFLKGNLDPSTPKTTIEKNGVSYDLMLVQTLQDINVRSMKFGYSISVTYLQNDYIGLNLKEEQIQLFVPNTTYVLIGKYKETQGNNGKTFLNFTVHFAKALCELIEDN